VAQARQEIAGNPQHSTFTLQSLLSQEQLIPVCWRRTAIRPIIWREGQRHMGQGKHGE
jgi:hypothetical protein